MPRYFDVHSTILIVVGYGILPEEEDRPVAYDLKRAIMARTHGAEGRSAVVVTDMWMVNQDMADLFPAIAVGGPGVNAFAAQIYEELPVAFTRDERVFVQMSADGGKRAALWGMDQEATREAAERFVNDGLLERFLKLAWKRL
ncbi:MAG TPA: hypothetical protein VMI34_13495 [Candidatus Bathyarchaeia archaeon]|nr:hypothetical protein [Candidatus Bathyarchaeia archaeon]